MNKEQHHAVHQTLLGIEQLFRCGYHLDEWNIAHIRNAIDQYPEQNWIDALSKYQVMSKDWLVREIIRQFGLEHDDHVYIMGGWLGTVPFLMELAGSHTTHFVNFDIDLSVREPSMILNARMVSEERYVAQHRNMYDLNYEADVITTYDGGEVIRPSLVINTSCEHIRDLPGWIDLLPKGTKVALQTNNMYGIDGHINCVSSLYDFKDQTKALTSVLFADELDLGDTWKRFMIIGVK